MKQKKEKYEGRNVEDEEQMAGSRCVTPIHQPTMTKTIS